MKKVLIINLGSANDVMESSALVSSILNVNPHEQIHYLCKDTHKHVAKIINGLETVSSLSVDELETILNNPLYSDAFALNKLTENLSELLDSKWDKVINYDNSSLSAYICAALEKDHLIGAEVYKNGNVITSNEWAGYQNFCLDQKERLNIDKITMRHHIANTSFSNSNKRIRFSSDFNLIANQNFQRIKNNDGIDYHFIGFYIPTSNESSLNIETLKSSIRLCESHKEAKPVLIHNGCNYSIEVIKQLNSSFNNSLISVHADTEALPSVLSNLKVFISERGYVSIMAQALNIGTIEISNLKPVKYHFSGMSKALIIDNSNSSFEFYDLAYCLNHFLGSNSLDDEMTASPIYTTESDDYGFLISQINGPICIEDEINYHIRRALDFQLLGFKTNANLINHLKECTSSEVLKKYNLEHKEVLTTVIKTLLGTLRSVKTALSSKEGMQHFLINLDKLIQFNKNDNLCSVAVGLFEAKVENITGTQIEENLQAIEKHLFELKNDLQQINLFLDSLISSTRPKFQEASSL